MKHIFIVNPVAGGKDSTEAIQAMALSAFSQSDESFELIRTAGPHDAEEIVRRIAESGEQARIYACGGDGTFCECVNGAAGYGVLPNLSPSAKGSSKAAHLKWLSRIYRLSGFSRAFSGLWVSR